MVSTRQETLVGVVVIVALISLLALLLLRMGRTREVDVEEDFWLTGPLDRVAAGLPAALGQVPRLRVVVLDRTTFELVCRDRRTPAVLVATEHGPLLRVTGRLEKDQLPALRAVLAPMTARA